MKKILLAIFISLPCISNAQNTNDISAKDTLLCNTCKTIGERLFIEWMGSTTFQQHGMTPLKSDFIIGYEPVNRLHVMVNLSGIVGLYNRNGVKTYFQDHKGIGGGLGYQLVCGKNGAWNGETVEVRALISSTIGHPELKYTSYEIGLLWYNRYRTSPILGIGFRHVNYHNAIVQDAYNIYLAVGVRL